MPNHKSFRSHFKSIYIRNFLPYRFAGAARFCNIQFKQADEPIIPHAIAMFFCEHRPILVFINARLYMQTGFLVILIRL